ncbi:MAG: hypothetical protein CM1200mP32_12810 [Methanobacteriota archaeon]|nr:MAG: hypothetical protein CM1200mP32_10650 [Euryarchaeota archaeon]GIT11788.1 MAG: hypothetical protein CM1200mP32_12810 [Euryarchaeota archaeon]GIT41859.1 MAG: hypothetical protein Ct9H300mP10_08690 [Euryarchaeota archaeon]
METRLSDCLAVFHGATRIALRDGQLSNGEKRLLVKLAHALKLDEDEPRQVYDAVVENRGPGRGREISDLEMILVYGQVLEAVLIHTDRSDDELTLVAYLRRAFSISDADHRSITRSLDRQLEQTIHRNVLQDFRMRLDDTMDRIGGIFDRLGFQI